MRSSKEVTAMDNRHTVQDSEAISPELDEALRNFRLSVHAWSDAAYNRSRTVAVATRSTVWRAAVGWALGCALVVGIVTGGVFQYQRGLYERNLNQQRAAEQQRKMDQQLAAHVNEDSDTLLAHVDSDVSRQVPAAMDPLASLVGGEE